ncbi:hypothetical protein [Limosilactobacillus reuteri]|uniref:hypothetical protein n=1 Tax=Limosilactobacillus reuteri TaxID=1598 RepID=UPI0021A60C9A|nr:hypothetical protein [Limosilactobacillus reuteri]MCT3199038.1 hypothetical protein [Limosilactobacillus reuteri]
MSEFKLPHVEDLATNSKLPGQLTENFKAIEQEDVADDKLLADEIQARKELERRVDKLNQRIDELNRRIDEHDKRLEKIEKLLFGFERITVTDPSDDIKASQRAVEVSDNDNSISAVTID